ncbi:hypothetical protein JHK87_051449 [Glycine soja]|nr:hypothetical protein JHK87_051449 [Glycine soja]
MQCAIYENSSISQDFVASRHEEAISIKAFADVGYGTFEHFRSVVQVQPHHNFSTVRWLRRRLPPRSPLGLTASHHLQLPLPQNPR